MSNNSSELNIEQKLFIFTNGVLDNPSFKVINNFLKLFTLNNQR